jgi:hypothetical protein
MQNKTGLLLAAAALLTASGCASILDGGTQVVTFNSDPRRVKIFINGVQVGVTPLSTQVKRSKDTIVVAKKDGYEDEPVALQTRLNTYFWGNILCGGLLGSTTDYATGAMIEYAPNMYFITLEPIKKSDGDHKRSSDEKRVRNFILVSYSDLAADLVKGQGEYLASLSALLGVRAHQSHEIIGALKQLSARYEDIPAFAEAVIAQFL